MKRRYLFFVFLYIWTFSSCRESPYRIIDEAIESAGSMEMAYLERIDSLKLEFQIAETPLDKWMLAYKLFGLYCHYNNDSTYNYTQQLLHYQWDDPDRIVSSKSAEIRHLVRQSKFAEAEELFNSMSVSEQSSRMAISDYYYCGERLYSELYAFDPEKGRREISRLARGYTRLDSTSISCRLLNAKKLRYNGRPGECIDLLKKIPPEMLHDYDYSLYHYNLALAYEELGMDEDSRTHLILSAHKDLCLSVKDYSSLYSLGMALFRDGDTQRACTYLNKSIKDALDYNYPSGLRRSASANLVVNDILHKSETRQRKLLILGIVIISALALLSIFLVLYLRLLLYKIRRINTKLKQTSATLESISLIKDSFLASYMELAAGYIRKVDDTKSRIRRTLKSDGLEGVSALLRTPSYADEEYPNYYRHFDETFLSIFPDFIQDVNNYMQPSRQFHIGKTGSHVLNTELRILALIRLGITDSDRIAIILHTSRGTVFTYRSKMKRYASCPSEDFESHICELR